jgi:CRP-like cAMP-binding protein
MSWAINNTPNIYFFEAMEDLELIRAPRDEVIEFVRSEPELLYNLLSRVYIGTDGLLSRMTYLMSGSAYERLIAELIIIAKRFGVQNKRSIAVNTSEKDIAGQTGMTRETVSREIKALKNRGLVSFAAKKLIIIDIRRFEEELSGL